MNKKITKLKKEIERLEKIEKDKKIKMQVKNGIHCLHRVSGSYPNINVRFKTSCGAKPIRDKADKEVLYFRKFKNASFYESEVTCPKCKANLR